MMMRMLMMPMMMLTKRNGVVFFIATTNFLSFLFLFSRSFSLFLAQDLISPAYEKGRAWKLYRPDQARLSRFLTFLPQHFQAASDSRFSFWFQTGMLKFGDADG